MKAGKIGILTGGGDVPGLNSVIKTVVYRGSEVGRQVTGIRRGWEGLTHVNFDDPASVSRYILPLTRLNTRTMALTPDESQKFVLLMSAISRTALWFSAARSSSRTVSALVTSISAGSVTTATWPIHSTGKRS